MEFEISEFKEEDRAELRLLYSEVRKETFGWIGTQNLDKDTFDADTKGEEIIVAKTEGKIAGFISIWLPDNFIHHLYIRKEYRRKGLGEKLIHEVKSKLRKPLTLKCLVDNVIAVKFYQKNGWEAKSTGISDHGVFILFELV